MQKLTAKPITLPYGSSMYLPSLQSYLVVCPCMGRAPHLTLWQDLVFRHPTILPCGISLYLQNTPSYLVICPWTFQAPHLTLCHVPVLAKPPILPRGMYFSIPPYLHSVLFYHIALSMKTCHMLMAEPSTYDMFAFFKKNGYVDG